MNTRERKGSEWGVADSAELRKQIKAIESLDFHELGRKLAAPEPEGMGWTWAQVRQAILYYRRFLELHLHYPDRKLVPNLPVDHVWHLHILDTRKYAADCDTVFGYFLHHDPYFGLDGKGDFSELIVGFRITGDLLRMYFDEGWDKMDCFHESRKTGETISGQGPSKSVERALALRAGSCA